MSLNASKGGVTTAVRVIHKNHPKSLPAGRDVSAVIKAVAFKGRLAR